MPFIDAWFAELKVDKQLLEKFYGLLSNEEIAHAQTIKIVLLQQRYILVRGWLRTILANYTRLPPETLQFCKGEFGKPTLTNIPLYFNLSHSKQYLAIAVGDMEHIGIDIETIKPRSSFYDLAERCFSDYEFNYWQNLNSQQQQLMFYQLWTKKEAFVKAVGRGIAVGLQHCEIDLDSGLRFSKLPKLYEPSDWRIFEFSPAIECCGAIVTPNIEVIPEWHLLNH